MRFYTNAQVVGNSVVVRGYDNKRPFSEKIRYKPRMFVPSNTEKSDGEWSTIYGQKLERIDFDSIGDAKEFVKSYSGVSNFKIYGSDKFLYTFINEHFPDEVVYDQSLINVAYIDIEVSSANGFPAVERAADEVISITLKKNNIFHVWGYHDYVPKRKDVFYYQCNNERELLTKFVSEWAHEQYPDVITGWNISFFDIPYLVKRMITVLGEDEMKRFSPWKSVRERQVTILNKEHTTFDIGGVATLDYLELYRKFTYSQQESYRLDHIANVELNERKLSFAEYGNIFTLISNKSKKIEVDPNKDVREMADFEKWCLMRDRIRLELERRKK